MPPNGSPAMNTRGPIRRPASYDSRCSRPANALASGSRTLVTPYASQMRPSASPYPDSRCACMSMRPGMTVSARRVDHGPGVKIVAVGIDRLNAPAVDHDVHIAAQLLIPAVEHRAGMDHHSSGQHGLPGEAQRDRFRRPAVGRHAPQSTGGEIDDVPRIAFPGGGVRAGRRSRARHRPEARRWCRRRPPTAALP